MKENNSVWVELQENILNVLNHYNDNTHDIDDVADAVARKVCRVLALPDIIQDTNYLELIATKEALTSLFKGKGEKDMLNKTIEKLQAEKAVILAELEQAGETEEIVEVCIRYHANRKALREATSGQRG